jgi:N-acetylneuraminate synthase
MIDLAIEMKADCVKFQMRHLDKVYRKRSINKAGEDLGTEYVIDLLRRFELSVDEQKQLADYCKKREILYLCTPWDEESVRILEGF